MFASEASRLWNVTRLFANIFSALAAFNQKLFVLEAASKLSWVSIESIEFCSGSWLPSQGS